MEYRIKEICVCAVTLALFLPAAGCGKPEPEKAALEQDARRKSSAAVVKPEKAQEGSRSEAPIPEAPRFKNEKVLFGFENDVQFWGIPEWVTEKPEQVAKSAAVSGEYARQGISSLKVDAAFPGKIWTSALVETEEYFDFAAHKRISCDIYLPEGAPEGLKAKIIITVGKDWRFTEMASAIFLVPGRWTTVSASLEPGTGDWKIAEVDDDFRSDVRKIAIRVESNKGPAYSGPFYIDNIRVSE